MTSAASNLKELNLSYVTTKEACSILAALPSTSLRSLDMVFPGLAPLSDGRIYGLALLVSQSCACSHATTGAPRRNPCLVRQLTKDNMLCCRSSSSCR